MGDEATEPVISALVESVMPRTMPFHLDTDRHEDKMLRRLGAAYIAQYRKLPKAVRDLIEDQAGAVVDNSLMAKPREEIAELIRKHAPKKPVVEGKAAATPYGSKSSGKTDRD